MRVKDIQFKNAEHVIEEIKSMNVKGGSPFGRAAAWAFRLACEQEEFQDTGQLQKRMEHIAQQMLDLKPTMATIFNTWQLVKQTMLKENQDVYRQKQAVISLCSNIIAYSFEAVEQLGVYGASLIQDEEVIMMHSYSSTLMGIFLKAAEMGRKFTVICTESRPLRESRLAVNMLRSAGVSVIYITDASIYEFLPRADMVIMGADTLCADGSVANKMGTAMIAGLAKACKKKVYIASELYKLDLRTQVGYRVVLERRSAWEILNKDDFDSLDGIDVVNQFFDITPASDIQAIICEYGIIPPASVLNFWKDLGIKGGVLVANPIPEAYSMDAAYINAMIEEALECAKAQNIKGKDTTPYLLAHIVKATQGKSLAANIQLVYHNAEVGAALANAYAKKE